MIKLSRRASFKIGRLSNFYQTVIDRVSISRCISRKYCREDHIKPQQIMGDSSIIQINTCGISNHAKTALGRFFYENKPKRVSLNETRKTLDNNHFENFFTESSCNDLGVAMLIEKLVLHARITALEIKHFDSL